MRTINLIVIHCSATPEGKDFTVKDIDRWHRQRGFRRIGYHYVIYRDGSVHEGRPISEVGAHAAPFNAHSIGICYIGGLRPSPAPLKGGREATTELVPADTRTPEQKAAIVKLLKELKRQFPEAKIVGHRDLGARKACPCFDAAKEYDKLFRV